jgi:hypothetical protein
MPNFEPVTGQIATLRKEWFDTTRTAFQDCTHAEVVDGVPTCQIVLSDGTELARANAGTVTAGGRLAAWLRNEDLTVYDSLGRRWPGAAVAVRGTSPDGALALKVLRNSYGPWDVIELAYAYDPADPNKPGPGRWRLSDGDAHDIQLLGGGAAIWMLGEDPYSNSEDVSFPAEKAWAFRAAYSPAAGRYRLVYQRKSDGALVCDGYLIGAPSASYYYYDIYVDQTTELISIVWSLTQADADVQLLSFTPAELEALPPSADNPPVPPDPPDPEPPDPEPPDPPDPEPPDPEPPDPEPPDPEPAPEPEPEPSPGGPLMLFIETRFEKTNPDFEVMKFDIIANADGTESYRSVARANATTVDANGNTVPAEESKTPIYCVTDAGADEWRPSPGGPFESFRRVGTSLVADRPWNGVEHAYVRYCVEVA